jgi:hypothetical protein
MIRLFYCRMSRCMQMEMEMVLFATSAGKSLLPQNPENMPSAASPPRSGFTVFPNESY